MTAKQKKRKGKPRKPTARLLKYAEKRVNDPDKPKSQCAREAGYSEATARKAARDIEPSAISTLKLKDAIRTRITPEKIAQRIEEGMDAQDTKFFAHEGMVADSRDTVAWSERRQYTELAAKFGEYFQEKIDLSVHDERGQRLAELLDRLTQRAAATRDPGRTSATDLDPRS